MGSCLSKSKPSDENINSRIRNSNGNINTGGQHNGTASHKLTVDTSKGNTANIDNNPISGPFPAKNEHDNDRLRNQSQNQIHANPPRSYSASTTNSTKNNSNTDKSHNGMLTPAVSGVPMTAQSNDITSTNTNTGNEPVKILLLGSGESGKSTILKQMKIIHQNGYSQEERLMYKTTVYKNLVDCAKCVVDALSRFQISIDNEYYYQPELNNLIPSSSAEAKAANARAGKIVTPLSSDDLDYVSKSIISPDPDSVFDSHLATIIQNLWARPEVHKLIAQRRAEFYIMDSAPYLFSNTERIAHPDYIPSVNDILRARIKTTGIYESRFDMGGLNILMYDVGGQRSERKKWIHCFENVTLIIFCVALSEYDQVLLEQKGQNRMAESLVLFDSIINSPWFARTSVVLFLNKIDVFTEKLPYSPLENYFPDYTGGNDVNKAVKYILWRFTQANKSGLNIYPHLTQATDTSNIRLVFAAVKETILQNALKDSGIL